jgi:phage FluMu protein gp41
MSFFQVEKLPGEPSVVEFVLLDGLVGVDEVEDVEVTSPEVEEGEVVVDEVAAPDVVEEEVEEEVVVDVPEVEEVVGSGVPGKGYLW